MPFCSQCGIQINPSDRFCPACGHQVEQPGVSYTAWSAQPPPPPQPTPPPPPHPPGAYPGAYPPAPIPLEVQGVGIRFAAQIVDSLLIAPCYYFIGRQAASRVVGGLTPDGFELHGMAALGVIGLTTLVWLTYFCLLEGLWNGQTVGKKLLRIQVVRQDGAPMDLSASLVRNLLRVVDALFGYLLGAILIWTSPLKQRLGDRVAHTLVVRKTT